MEIIYGIFIFLLGALFASFAYLLGYRIPRNEPKKSRSYCDHCEHQLRLIDVFPILGYVVNLGRCRYCKEKISIKYPLFEILGGILFLSTYMIIGDLNLELLLSFVLITVLLIQTVSDLYYHEVIDRAWLIGLVFFVIIRIIQNDFITYLLSSIGLFGVLIAIALLGQFAFKKESLGGGDVKLFLMIGFALTFVEGLLAIFLASFIGLIYALLTRIKSGKEMAFIPMISIGVLMTYWFGQNMIQWYLNLLGM
ncbi:MAG: prepilin peptidase [Tenericutes bacterium]|jgi:leader peptidase (prepilin peptidase)/N-methyltransferase|nr:prepilin peptidase [Mycoplasmatota bacterium]